MACERRRRMHTVRKGIATLFCNPADKGTELKGFLT